MKIRFSFFVGLCSRARRRGCGHGGHDQATLPPPTSPLPSPSASHGTQEHHSRTPDHSRGGQRLRQSERRRFDPPPPSSGAFCISAANLRCRLQKFFYSPPLTVMSQPDSDPKFARFDPVAPCSLASALAGGKEVVYEHPLRRIFDAGKMDLISPAPQTSQPETSDL